ncbi:hypothetical protein A2704_02935 [Candidatus Kaiserbacteria bacterium RIFCSPHIGHO2_01_FULL_54_36b]|uniref:Uncharacterized protein n=1 Tax=Candidatus Kaiserbacteria bacterium RIFCSPHIGHO2_01_FULL_54_36b TaxID=1798483 RepID=A0A1F6CPU2_9BACT|nr:MAG: hypothetical protein A2704_02935 [Candidatus Kaiserbacteria bacterium RIFCSPHIGHO2_01_FULL_54_36b]
MWQRYIIIGFVLITVGALASTQGIRTADTGDSDEGPLLNSASSTAAIPMPPMPELDVTFVPSSQEFAQNDAPASSAKPTTASIGSVCEREKMNNFECYQDHYTSVIKNKGIAAAFDDIKARYNTNAYVKAQCHPLSHVIGRVAADSFESVGEAYASGDGFCWSGYYHGVLESFVGKIGLSNLTSRLNDVCASVKDKASYGFDYYNCVHGLGHGIMAITDDELFTSFSYCDRLNGAWEQESCASGAYMENVIVDGLNHFTKYLRPAEPLYPCTASPEKYKRTCYLMQTSYVLKINQGDFKNLFSVCAGAEEAYRMACWQGLGRDASGRSSSDIAQTKATCLLGNTEEEQTHCVIGAVKDFISYFHSDTQAKRFCSAFEDADIASRCLSEATDYYALL